MRTSRTWNKSSVAKILTLIAVAMCFALAFSLTLAFAPSTDFAGVASATTITATDKGTDYGTASPITSVGANVTGADIFTTSNSTATATTSWTWTADLSTVTPSQSGSAPSNFAVWKDGGDNNLWAEVDSVNNWGWGIKSVVSGRNSGFVMAYSIPSFIRTLINNDNFTVKAQLSFLYVGKYNDGNIDKTIYYRTEACKSDSIPAASSAWNNKGSSLSYASANNTAANYTATCAEIGLARFDECVAFLFAFSAGTGLNSQRGVWFKDIKIKFSISLKTVGTTASDSAWVDGSTTRINDGGDVVKVSESFKNLSALATSITNTSLTASMKLSGSHMTEQYIPFTTSTLYMPVYHSSISSQLSSYADSWDKSTSKISLTSPYSYAQTVPGQTGTYNYYRKYGEIEFADTYNYGGMLSNTKFNASSYTSTYNTYAGISGYYATGSTWAYGTTTTYSADTSKINRMASGIRTVSITVTPEGGSALSAQTWNVYSLTTGSDNYKTFGSGTTYVGMINVHRNSRGNVTVKMYINKNATVSITLTDFSGSYNTSNVWTYSTGSTYSTVFSGIDYTVPEESATSLDSSSGYFANSGEYTYINDENANVTTLWWKKEQLDARATSDAATGSTAPYVWFYSVQRRDTIDEIKALTASELIVFDSYNKNIKPLLTTLSTYKTAGKPNMDAPEWTNPIRTATTNAGTSSVSPIAYGTFTSFKYDFSTGRAMGYGATTYSVANPNYVSGTMKGAGYYAFTFYKVDIAGNFGEVVTQYVKVDYDNPDYTVQSDYEFNDDITTISQEQLFVSNIANGTWALGNTTVTFTIPSVNFSGNTIAFKDNGDDQKEYFLTVDRNGRIAIFTETGLIGEVVTNRGSTPTERIKLTINSLVEQTEVYFSYTVVYDNATEAYIGTITVEFEGNESGQYPTVAWQTAFDISSVAYANFTELEADTAKNTAASKGSASILIDRIDPSMPTLSDDNDYLVANRDNESGELLYVFDVNNKVWKTDGYTLQATLASFQDSVANSAAFAPYMGVYTAFAYVDSVDAFLALANLNIAEEYKNIKTNDDAIARGLGKFYITTMNNLGNDAAVDFPIEFFQSNGAGMRVIYIWTVDQAGRVSELNSYYVLIDQTNYRINTSMLDAIVSADGKNFGKNGTIASDVTANVKRGQSVTITVTLDSGYVPFRFNNGDLNLLFNNSPDKYLEKSGSDFDEFITVSHDVGSDVYTITYTLDDNSLLGKLSADDAFNFTMSARKVVTKTPSYNKYYDATHLDMKEYVALSDERAKDYLKFEFYSSFDNSTHTGVLLDEAPINVGIYYIRIYIDDVENNQYNEAFVLELSANDVSFGYIVPIQFSIVKGRVEITPVVSTSEYGDIIKLDYNISGFNFENNIAPVTGEYLDGSLKLNTTDWGNVLLGVGPYAIVQNETFVIRNRDQSVSGNYDVVFVSGVNHTVTQREVEIVAVNETKQYGDSDPVIRFSVDPAQFEWYSNNTGNSVERLIKDTIFSGYTSSSMDGNLYLFLSNGRISRVSGENVGSYAYDRNSAVSISNNNYKIVLSVEGKEFTITKREVKIDASGYFSVIMYSQYDPSNPPDTSGIKLEYTLESKDITFTDQIRNAIAGLLKLSGDGDWSMDYEGYYGGYAYTIVLGDNNNVVETDEMIITLQDGATYYIYVGEKNAVILQMKSGARLEFVYGQIQAGDLTFKNLKDYFDISTEADVMPDFDNITWSISLTTSGYLGTGSYNIVVSDAKLFNGSQELVNQVVVETFTVKVNPAEIVIRPTSSYKSKIYGDEDNFHFGFVIESINGVSFSSGTYAGLSYSDIQNSIIGEYVRGRYTSNDTLRALGDRYDPATDSNGFIIGGNGDYYSYTVGTAFTSSNSGFTVRAGLNNQEKFVINQVVINLDVKNFVGVNKAFDNSTAVNFGSTIAYDLSSALKRSTDDLRLAFIAEYTKIGSMNEPTNAGIIFTNIHLEGADANNYVLNRITNSSNFEGDEFLNELWNGTEEVSTNGAIISANVKVVIYYINNIDKTDLITISMGAIAVRKSDFTVSKVYDGNNNIVASNIAIANRSDENGGSTMLYQLWGSSAAHLISVETFSKADVGSYYVNITLFFEIPGIKEGSIDITTDGAYYDESIKINIIENQGIQVEITGLAATITQKVLGVDAFTEIKPIDQDYSAQAIIKNTEITLANGAIVDEDVNLVEVNLVTQINDGDVDARVHTVEFSDTSWVSSSNYRIDVDALNKYYSGRDAIKVTINKAKLKPNVLFKDREYDGSAVLEPVTTGLEYEFAFVTENYTSDLMGELVYLSNYGDITYWLSDKGEENENVMTDADGNVISHNVIVRGVNIKVESAGKVNLNNYVMYGGRYNSATEEYESVDAVADNKIDDYELIGAVEISRKTLKILSNNVIIKDKVYDMTDVADIKITLENSGIANEEQAKHISLTATGKFSKSTVDTNIPVTISNVVLVAEDGYEYLLNNYILPSFTERRYANILPRPIGFTVDFGEKTYDSDAKISTYDVSFRFENAEGLGMLGNDADSYAVQVESGFAYYIDKNVAIVDGQVVGKAGAVFNPTLLTNRSKVVNYVLTISTEIYSGDGYIAYVDRDFNLHYGELAENANDVLRYYYALPTADKYIAIEYGEDGNLTNQAEIDAAFAAGAVAGRFVLEGVGEIYAIDSAYEGDVTGIMTEMTYVSGYGKINQKVVSVSASAIKIVEGSTAFDKMYDGTKYFFGKDGVDYNYEQGGVVGVIEGDDVKVSGVVAEYDTAYTTANYVVFTPSEIEGADKDNYRIDSKLGSAYVKGSITKRPIDSILSDGTIEYGTAINTIVGDIEYKAHGNVTENNPEGLYILTEWEGQLYLPLSKYEDMMGFKLGNYQDALMTRMYVIDMDGDVMNGFYKLDENAELDETNLDVYYIQLSGITTLPAAKATFGMASPNAGDSSIEYKLTRVTVDNYEFIPQYTDTKTEGNSVLTVVKKDLYVATSGNLTIGRDYTKNYGGNDPNVELFFLDKDGNAGFASGDNYSIVFGQDYMPEIRWGVLDTGTGEWIMLGAKNPGEAVDYDTYKQAYKYALISDRLGADKEYVARIFAPEKANNYETVAKNYNVILGTGFEIDGSVIMMTYTFGNEATGKAYTLKTPASKLEIKLPEMTGLTLHGAENNTFNYTYDGNNHVRSIVIGARTTDEIMLENNGAPIETVNAGEYTGRIVVRRYIKIDDSDDNGYYNEWISDEEVTVNIAKASSQLKAVTTSRYYDGTAYAYEVGKDDMISSICDLFANQVDISYAVLNGEDYEAVDEMRNAGIYRVTVALNDRFEDDNPNYAKATVVVTYTILKALVNVNISSAGYVDANNAAVKTLVAEYDGNKTSYEIGYTINNMSGLPQELQLPLSQTALVFEKEIASSGRYSFSVKLVDGALDINNYKLVDAQGVLELTTKTVETTDANVSVDKAIVANRLVAKEINESKGTGADIDLWSTVNQYMPYIDSQAKLASVVQLEIYCDDVLVKYEGGNIDVSVSIPDVVGDLQGKAIYTVTAEGGLKLLKDYTVSDGRIEYSTDYLGALVFVDLTPAGMPLWQIILIAVGASLFAIALVWTIVAFVLRKSKLKKLA